MIFLILDSSNSNSINSDQFHAVLNNSKSSATDECSSGLDNNGPNVQNNMSDIDDSDDEHTFYTENPFSDDENDDIADYIAEDLESRDEVMNKV